MNIKRLYKSIRFLLFFDQMKRADYARRKKIFHHVGKNVRLPAMLIPLYPELISFHDNVEIASGVKFVVHDAIHGVLNFKYHGCKEHAEFPENIDCIEIMDNVFIGTGTTILSGVRVGPNAVVGSNSLINKDIPANSVCAGIPAKPIGKFENLVEKRRNIMPFTSTEDAWNRFQQQRHENL